MSFKRGLYSLSAAVYLHSSLNLLYVATDYFSLFVIHVTFLSSSPSICLLCLLPVVFSERQLDTQQPLTPSISLSFPLILCQNLRASSQPWIQIKLQPDPRAHHTYIHTQRYILHVHTCERMVFVIHAVEAYKQILHTQTHMHPPT